MDNRKFQKAYKEYEYFDSVQQLIDQVENIDESLHKSAWEDDERFRGTKDMAEAITIAHDGYELDTISAKLDGIRSQAGYELKPTFQVSGGVVEMGLYMEGIPECMIDFEQIEAHRFVHLILGVTEAGGIDSNQILNRAAAMCSIVDGLESDNYRIKVSLAVTSEKFAGGSHSIMTFVEVKGYKDIMSVANLAGVLHTSFFRRILWANDEGKPEAKDRNVGRTSVSNNERTMRGITDSGYVLDDYVFLPSITERRGGTEGVTFDEEEDIETYSKYIRENIEDLTVKLHG